MIIELQEFAVIIKIFSFEKLEKNQIREKKRKFDHLVFPVCVRQK